MNAFSAKRMTSPGQRSTLACNLSLCGVLGMNSLHAMSSSTHHASNLSFVHAQCRRPLRLCIKSSLRRSTPNTYWLLVFNGDVVADDKLDSSEKTVAASSRGFAGSPQKPEDFNQSTPAASLFMQVCIMLRVAPCASPSNLVVATVNPC